MEKIKLYEEYKLIEKTEAEVNGAWKGAMKSISLLKYNRRSVAHISATLKRLKKIEKTQ